MEVSSTCKFVESLAVAIPFEDGSGHSLESLEVEFEWKPPPPRCETCKIFDHWDAQCPKRVVVPSQSRGDGLGHAILKKGKGKANQACHFECLRLPKTKSNHVLRPVTKDPPLSNDKVVSKTVMEENNSSNVPHMKNEDGSMLGGEAGNKSNSKNTMHMEEKMNKVQKESSLYSWFMEAKKASTAKASATPWAINALIAASVTGVVAVAMAAVVPVLVPLLGGIFFKITE
nr:zinc knuckle CX2CX4HX4C [Tanacetum cinerariifolium]